MEELLKNLQDHIERYGHARIYLSELEMIVNIQKENDRLRNKNNKLI
jgi:hypothetical protein